MRAEKILTSSEKFHIELGLGRISRILELLGNPEKNLKIIHVAGSNGKGSTCAILEEIFVQAGLKTGKFTSPHLFSYCERIAVNKEPISDAEFDELIEKISALDFENKIGLTEFEILTAAGFLYFNQKACDIVILEVGLGGRLDSTNVIANPLVSIVTSISLEHKERLGDTIEKIAYEKAGIFKKGSPAVFLKENKGYETLKKEALRLGARVYEAKTIDIKEKRAIINGENVEFALLGQHQGENLALALCAVDILNETKVLSVNIDFETVKKALSKVKWKFRLEEVEYKGNKLLIDACHNPDGARVLAEYLDENYKNKKIKLIFGCLKNKDYKAVLEHLLSKDNRRLRFYEFDYPNALKYEDLMENLADCPTEVLRRAAENVEKIENPYEEMSKNDADLTVVCGSIYMLGQLFKDIDIVLR